MTSDPDLTRTTSHPTRRTGPARWGGSALLVGILLFGIAALRGDVLPRLRAVPVIAGVVGLLWMFLAFDARPVEGNPEAFLAMRTAFGISWLPLAYILLTDRGPRDASDGPLASRDRGRQGPRS
jgi:hypothetical protein